MPNQSEFKPTKIFANLYDADRLGGIIYNACIVCYDEKLYNIAKKKLGEDNRYWKFISEQAGDLTEEERNFYSDFRHEYRHPKTNRFDGFFVLKCINNHVQINPK